MSVETFSLTNDAVDGVMAVEAETPAADETPTMTFWQLVYDIPSYRGIPNPSNRLRWRAIRLNKSVWIIPESDIPHMLIKRLRDRGATCYLCKFDATAGKELIEIAINSIKSELKDAIRRARKAQQSTDRKYDEAAAGEGKVVGEKEQRKYDLQHKLIVKRLKSLLDDTREVSNRFQLPEGVVEADLGQGMRALTAIDTAMQQRATVIAETIERLKMLNTTTGDGLAATLDADELPMYVAADYLMDHDEDTSALRDAFGM